MQRLIRETGLRLGTRSDRQAHAGFGVVRDMIAAEALALKADPRLQAWMNEAGLHSSTYLAHEFMNGHWSPCWHADVAAALGEARLDFVGTAVLTENFPELMMSGPQRIIYEKFDDTLTRELIKDTCMSRTLRHDIYVRGARRIAVPARDALLRRLTLGLAVPEQRVALEVHVAAGKAELAKDFYGPVVAMLAKGPAHVADLLRAPGAVATKENPAELAGLLVGTRQAIVVARPGAPLTSEALRLNAALAGRLAITESLNRQAALASPALGAGLACAMTDLFYAGRVIAGEETGDVEAWVSQLGEPLDDENRNRVREALEKARREFLPVMRGLGALPA
jgi:hypothetical protein